MRMVQDNPRRFKYLTYAVVSGRDLIGFLDMLRYDSASIAFGQVGQTAAQVCAAFEGMLEHVEAAPAVLISKVVESKRLDVTWWTVERWRSFGFRIEPITIDQAEAVMYGHASIASIQFSPV